MKIKEDVNRSFPSVKVPNYSFTLFDSCIMYETLPTLETVTGMMGGIPKVLIFKRYFL